MTGYIVRRLLATVPVVLVVSLVVFALIRVVPGDVAVLMVTGGGDTSSTIDAQAQIEKLRQKLRLDLPLHEQYATWLWGAVRGDLGQGFWQGRPVAEEVARAVPVSIELAVYSLAISLVLAIPTAVLSAVRQDTWQDYVGRILSIAGLAIPEFWLGTLFVLLPVLWFNWIPPIRFVSLFEDPGRHLLQFLFPSLALGLTFSATVMRMLRSSLLEVLRQDFIRTAWSKGLAERTVILRHALKNALIPVITLLGLRVGRLLSGAVVIEVIFGLPGMGRMTADAIRLRDYPIVEGLVLFFAIGYALVNLVVDVAYAWLDPRIRYG